jgi:hypothetical protein
LCARNRRREPRGKREGDEVSPHSNALFPPWRSTGRALHHTPLVQQRYERLHAAPGCRTAPFGPCRL